MVSGGQGRVGRLEIFLSENKRERNKSVLSLNVCVLYVLSSAQSGEKALLLLRGIQWTADTFDCGDIDAADGCLDFLFHWNQWEDLCITHQSHDLRAYLSLHYRHLGAAQVFWSAFQYNGREFHAIYCIIVSGQVQEICDYRVTFLKSTAIIYKVIIK